MDETWLPIPGHEDYRASDHGRVMNRHGRVLSGWDCAGYRMVGLSKGVKCMVHRLVLETFVGPPPSDGHQCNHKDSVKSNNHVRNLEWVTPSENQQHSHDMRKRVYVTGFIHGNRCLDESDVPAIRKLLAEGLSQGEVAGRFGVSQATVSRALRA